MVMTNVRIILKLAPDPVLQQKNNATAFLKQFGYILHSHLKK